MSLLLFQFRMVSPYAPSPGTPRARATVYVPSVHVAIAVGDGPITTEYVADARARIQASTKAVLEITDPSKYAVTDTARKTLEGRKLFVINADTDMPAMTSARADRFLKICFDPDTPIPKPKNQGDLEKVMKDTHGQYFVTVVQVSSASEQNFFLRAINKESNFVYIACSCGDFVTSANICAEAVAVAAEVGVIDLEVQLTKMQPRRAAGRPGNEDKGWYDRTLGGRKRDAAWFLKVIRQNAPFYFYKWNVMRVFGGANWVGYVADFRDFGKGSGPRWHVVYDRAPNEPEDIVDTELSAALHLAVEMGVGDPDSTCRSPLLPLHRPCPLFLPRSQLGAACSIRRLSTTIIGRSKMVVMVRLSGPIPQPASSNATMTALAIRAAHSTWTQRRRKLGGQRALSARVAAALVEKLTPDLRTSQQKQEHQFPQRRRAL